MLVVSIFFFISDQFIAFIMNRRIINCQTCNCTCQEQFNSGLVAGFIVQCWLTHGLQRLSLAMAPKQPKSWRMKCVNTTANPLTCPPSSPIMPRKCSICTPKAHYYAP